MNDCANLLQIWAGLNYSIKAIASLVFTTWHESSWTLHSSQVIWNQSDPLEIRRWEQNATVEWTAEEFNMAHLQEPSFARLSEHARLYIRLQKTAQIHHMLCWHKKMHSWPHSLSTEVRFKPQFIRLIGLSALISGRTKPWPLHSLRSGWPD